MSTGLALATSATAAATTPAPADPRVERAWAVLAEVPDPEVPALSVVDLGIVREVIASASEGLVVALTPTYSGCPATEVIERSVLDALDAAGLGPARAELRRHPAWTTEWISEAGRDKLRAYGIAPPGRLADGDAPVRLVGALADAAARRAGRPAATPAAVPCPRCGSGHTERLSAFGSTACKALWRCLACREPFEQFKPI